MRVYPDQTVDGEFKTLGDAGYTGSLNDRQYDFLVDQGYAGALSDMLYAFRQAGGVITWDPSALFASGEEGAWYEPSTTTAFLSTTDLTPCGVGDSCGFLLDKSQGAGYSGGSFTGLGSELVTNGSFDTDLSGWTNGNTHWVWTAGAARHPSSGSYNALSWPVSLTAGTTYLVEFEIVSILSGTLNVLGVTDRNYTTAGNKSFTFSATGSETVIIFARDFGTTLECTIDNISVRELAGNHATQGTAPARPVLARVPAHGRRNLLERTEEFDNAYWAKAGVSVVANQAADGDGATTLDKIVESSASEIHLFTKDLGGSATGKTYTLSIDAQADGRRYLSLGWYAGSGDWVLVTYDLQSGTVTEERNNDSINGFSTLSSGISLISGSLYRCTLTLTALRGTIYPRLHLSDDPTPFANGKTNATVGGVIYLGDGSSGILVGRVQLEEASSASAYQKVTSQYDVTEAGVTSVSYVFDDEVDDAISWTAPADTDYTVARVDAGGTVTILTGQSLSGGTDILLEQDIAGYVAVDRALTSQETTDLTAYLEALA